MPGGYVHKVCAERACAAAGITPVKMNVMRLGSQGPDPLFLMGMFPLRPSSRPSKLAKSMHTRRTGRFLCALAREAKAGGAAERAYAMGYFTHYAVDCAVHPYVYTQSYDKKGKYSSPMHMSLERNWDTLAWRSEGRKGTPFSMPCLEEARADWPAVAALVARVANEVYPELDVTEDALMRAYSDTCLANRLTYSPHGLKYALYWLVERIAFIPGLVTAQCCPARTRRGDLLNREGRPWRAAAAPDVERSETVEELCAAGVRRGAELLTALQAYFDGETDDEALAAAVGDLAMDTGAKSRD